MGLHGGFMGFHGISEASWDATTAARSLRGAKALRLQGPHACVFVAMERLKVFREAMH